ncbi:MAG: TlyA family RNA methyltransferase, partial [Alphaproteobacteria bacterium]|nr:TlyA family RNA methyltransferase [Alphaproteobacteria bacterium]
MRLDQEIVLRNLYPSRAKAVAAINAGLVSVNGVIAKKPSQVVNDSDEIT